MIAWSIVVGNDATTRAGEKTRCQSSLRDVAIGYAALSRLDLLLGQHQGRKFVGTTLKTAGLYQSH